MINELDWIDDQIKKVDWEFEKATEKNNLTARTVLNMWHTQLHLRRRELIKEAENE